MLNNIDIEKTLQILTKIPKTGVEYDHITGKYKFENCIIDYYPNKILRKSHGFVIVLKNQKGIDGKYTINTAISVLYTLRLIKSKLPKWPLNNVCII